MKICETNFHHDNLITFRCNHETYFFHYFLSPRYQKSIFHYFITSIDIFSSYIFPHKMHANLFYFIQRSSFKVQKSNISTWKIFIKNLEILEIVIALFLYRDIENKVLLFETGFLFVNVFIKVIFHISYLVFGNWEKDFFHLMFFCKT